MQVSQQCLAINTDPLTQFRHIPSTQLGEAAYRHDIFYYNQGSDGLRGAFFNTKTLAADRALLSAARNIRQSFRSGSDIALGTYQWAGRLRTAFVPLVGFKCTISNSYLFTPYTLTR